MRIALILFLISKSVFAQDSTQHLSALHTATLEAEVVRLSDLVSMLSAQIKAMQSEQKANEAKAAEKAAIEASKPPEKK